ncbi:EAL domain-containing protein [Shewanella sp. YIC-542]|uniref:EAL domain-containing protein n=1 Tax=Shewanella mytili TaxID=3377111 RepID=UPI00398EB3AD
MTCAKSKKPISIEPHLHVVSKTTPSINNKCYLNSCIFYKNILNKNNIKQRCRYYHVGQHIIGRDGAFHGVEVLSRLANADEGEINYEDYFRNLNQQGHKSLLLEILNKICVFVINDNCLGSTRFFVNVERFSLMDSEVIKNIIFTNDVIKHYNDSSLVLEITERNSTLAEYTVENKYKLKDAGVLLAMDDSTLRRVEMMKDSLNLYDYLKYDIRFIKEMLANPMYKEPYLEFLYWCVENKIKLIAERVEFKEDYNLVSQMPFSYMQGFYELLNP